MMRGGYTALLTNDLDQLNDPSETAAIRRSRMHHIRFRMPGAGGSKALGRALGSVAAAMPVLAEVLDAAPSQRLVLITLVSGAPSDRFTVVDPQRQPPRYWR